MMALEAKNLSQQLADHANDTIRIKALVTLVDYGTEPVRRYVSAHAPGEHVKDICAETWKIAFEHINAGEFKDRGEDPIGYVIGIARLVSLRYVTRQRRTQQHEVAFDEMNEPAIEDARVTSGTHVDLALLRQALSDPEDLEVLQALLAEQTITEMADAWHCHYKTAWRRYHKFLERSRAVLDTGTMPA